MTQRRIPWAAPGAQYRAHRDAIQAAMLRVLESGSYVLGVEVEAFERAYADYCGAAHAVGVASGTDALILGLKALGIGAGDEVITVSHTAVATVAAIIAAGATPALVDIDPVYYTIDPEQIEAMISPRTRAIVPVHLYGQMADLDPVVGLARSRGLRLIEDCAQAAGARAGVRGAGSIGDLGCFSFYPTKNLGAIGDGGIVITSDSEIAARLRRLRQYGWNEHRETLEVGVNSRLDPLQAAILETKLRYLDADNERRAKIATMYAEGLSDLPLDLPSTRPGTSHVYHLYVVAERRRDALMEGLARAGIGSAVHYPVPVHRQAGYAGRVIVPERGLPVTERIVGRTLSLPMYPELSDDDVARVIAAVCAFYAAANSQVPAS